ncbi:hypothetical protein [Gemmatimonas sp.]|uniref:hypothetical protein n=1 Tax=Gemmatimonas sp. TaxID=1962908 RepID=UPI003983D586
MSFLFRCLSFVVLLLGAACDSEASRDTKTTGDSVAMSIAAPPGATDSTQGGMSGMAGMTTPSMPSMPMAGMSDDSVMRAHVAMMRQAGAGSLLAQLPRHRQLVANQLSRMAGEMRQMNMPADAAWSSMVDSLRQDLIRLPDLTSAQLGTAMPPHLKRITRLADMHQKMMQSMPR